MLKISRNVAIEENEIEIHAIRAQGAGGQNVNKVASAVHLRFDIKASSLPQYYKTRLLNLADRRITKDGVIIIKAQRHRSFENNREDALQRLQALIRIVAIPVKRRKPTRPTKTSKEQRLDSKIKRGRLKDLRRKINY